MANKPESGGYLLTPDDEWNLNQWPEDFTWIAERDALPPMTIEERQSLISRALPLVEELFGDSEENLTTEVWEALD